MSLPFITDEEVATLMGTPPRWDTWGEATSALFYIHAMKRIEQALGEEAATHVQLLAGCCSEGMDRAAKHLTKFNTQGVGEDELIALAKAEQAGGKP